MSFRYVLLTLTFLAAVSSMYVSVRKDSILYTCSGDYSAYSALPGIEISNQLSTLNSYARNKNVYASFNGSVKYKNQHYHLNRQIVYKSEIVDRKNGLIRIIPISRSRSTNDTLDSKKVESILFSADNKGAMIRVWRLNNKIILIGNPYVPTYSCISFDN